MTAGPGGLGAPAEPQGPAPAESDRASARPVHTTASTAAERRPAGSPPPLRIGLLNNMPDAALIQTERQFRRLVGPEVDLRLFAFRDTPRGPASAAHIAVHYAWHESLPAAGLDALIVSGSEPRLARLEDEPYFAALGGVVDWAAANTLSTLFSCLAAHAAVLHLDGIRRRRLPAKLSGIYASVAAGTHGLMAGMPERIETPQSRWHDLPEADLAAHGFQVLRRSDEIGADLFVRDRTSLMVFLQGHPEYDLDSLAREYRRDFNRFLDGSSAAGPSLPANYFAGEATAALEAAASTARDLRGAGVTMPGLDRLPLRPSDWPSASALLFRNWLACVAARRTGGRHATQAS